MKKAFLICAGMLGLALAAAFSPPVDFDEQWPNWRGPDNTGMARTGAPVRWSTTENVKWKTPIPGKGHSTPIIWENRIYLTTAIPTSPIPEAPGRRPNRPPRRPRAERIVPNDQRADPGRPRLPAPDPRGLPALTAEGFAGRFPAGTVIPRWTERH